MRSVLLPTLQRTGSALLLPLALAGACGGRANGAPENANEQVDSAGAPSDTGGAPSGAGGSASGATPSSPGSSSGASTGEPGVAGTAQGGDGAENEPLIDSGTRDCQDYRDCLGLDCVGALPLPILICATPCPDGDECTAHELCVSHEQLAATCLQRCEVVTDCAYPFNCFDVKENGVFSCVPAAWAQAWDR